MSAPSYDSYKESGVQRIGELPAHWNVVALKRLATFTYGDALAADVRGEGDIKVYGSNGPVGTHSVPNTSAPVVFVGRKGSCGALTWSDTAGFAIDTVYYVDPSCCRADLRWLYWTLHALGLEHSSQDTGVPGLSREVAHSSSLPLAPLAEQAAIAAFLDRETGKIDALVEAQTRLIELLKEKRQAVISHAVTKGLDPAAPMKDSGVEWLGQVPARWEVRRFAAACTIAEGQVDPKAEPYASMVLIAPNHIASATGELMALETAAEQGAESGKYRVQEGDIVYSKIRPALAKVVVSPCDGLCSADMYPLRARADTDPHFLKWVLLSPGFTAWAVLESERVAMPKINREKLNELRLPVPPHTEQASIAAHVNEQTKAFDMLAREADAAIALLQERRAALISAAVTGKIDVRGLAPEQAEAA